MVEFYFLSVDIRVQGIAMMVELLAGALIGDNFSFETATKDNNDGGPPSGGEFILAISPDKISRIGMG